MLPVLMPFTYLGQRQLSALLAVFDRLAVCRVLPQQTDPHLAGLADSGQLTFFTNDRVDPTRVRAALDEAQRWARLHGGQIGDLAAYQQALDGLPPLVSETDPSQIRTQVHRAATASMDQTADDPLYRAALFLAMAHEYDRQQAAVANDLAAVAAQQELLAQRMAGLEPAPDPGGPAGDDTTRRRLEDAGGFKTGRRINAWARFAWPFAEQGNVLITPSTAVMDHLVDTVDGIAALGVFRGAPDAAGSTDDSFARELAGVLAQLSTAPDMAAAAEEGAIVPDTGRAVEGVELVLYGVAGRLPTDIWAFDDGLDIGPQERAAVNTVFGHLRIGRWPDR